MISDGGQTVSVVVPVYNVESYLEECLDSILGQTYRDIELVIVDDGSTDSSLSICKMYAQVDDRVCLVSQSNGGLSSARNTGIDLCHGSWMTFVDSDDALRTDAIEMLVKAAMEYGADIACCGFTNDMHGTSPGDINRSASFKCASGSRVLHYSVVTNHACGKLYAARLFRNSDIRYPDGRRYEDIATTYRLFDETTTVAFTDAPFYLYRLRDDSITATPSARDIDDLEETYREMSEHYAGSSSDDCLIFLATTLYQIQRVAAISNAPGSRKREAYAFVRKSFRHAMFGAAMRHLSAPMSKKILLMGTGFLPMFLEARCRIKRRKEKYCKTLRI